jgi:hypothetical protein
MVNGAPIASPVAGDRNTPDNRLSVALNDCRKTNRYFDPSKPRAKDFTPAVSDAIARGPTTTGALDEYTSLVGSNTANKYSVWLPAGKVSVNTTK